MKLGRKFQAGGPMPAGAPAPAPQGGEDPTAMLMQAAQQAVQGQDCQMAMQVCQMVIEALGGGGGPQEAAPQEAAPAPAEGEPVYRRGGRLVRRLKDFYDKTVVNQANASEFLPEQARIALRNAKLDPYIEISKALVSVAGSVAGAGIIRGGMTRSSKTISAGGSTSDSAGSSLTTRYDSKGNLVGYAKTEMTRGTHSSSYNTTRSYRQNC